MEPRIEIASRFLAARMAEDGMFTATENMCREALKEADILIRIARQGNDSLPHIKIQED